MPSKKRKCTGEANDAAKKVKSDAWKLHGPVLSKNLQPVAFRHDDTTCGFDVIYGFDIDDTIITTKSGAKFATNSEDWKWLSESVPKKLKELADKKAKIVFFTNQAGIEKGNANLDDLCRKFDSIIAQLGLPISVYISTGYSNFRKPSTGLWDLMMTHHKKGQDSKAKAVDVSKCVYVGDAAGRPKDWKPGARKDFSCSDRQFAANIGCEFKTPDEFFLGESATSKFEWKSYDPKDAAKTFKTPYKTTYHSEFQEVVVLMGMPASGKSTFFRRFFEPHGYVHVNRDLLGTESKCVSAVKEALGAKKSVVVDNTNPNVQSRLQYISIGETFCVPTRCFILNTPPEVCKHLNFVRQNSTKGAVRRIPDVGFNVYKSKFSAPTVSEGFAEITEVDFYPIFDKHSYKDEFMQWTEG